MYKVFLERRAEKDIDALDRGIREKVIERLLLLEENTRPLGVKKLVGTMNAWRLRVGDWRIIYEIYDKKKEVKVYRVKHRSKAYLP